MDRRKFLSLLVGAGAVSVAALSLGSVLGAEGSLSRYFIPQKAVTGGGTFPTGSRVVRIRVLNDDQSWTNALETYTTQDVLGWIKDLKVTTLNRYFSGPQDPKALLPAAPGAPNMTVKEFLQASIDACQSPSSTTMFPRISYSQYYVDGGEANFLETAEKMFSICGALDPAQTLLSVDNYDTGSTTTSGSTNTANLTNSTDSSSSDSSANPQVGDLADKLYAMGWTGLAWGACGSPVPAGSATFAMICATPNGTPDIDTMYILQTIGGYGEFEVQMDFPDTMSSFAAQSPDSMADVLSQLAAGQSTLGYDFMYPIIQLQSAETTSTFEWDSTKIFTSPTGQYRGQSLYDVMKSLMEAYNSTSAHPATKGSPGPAESSSGSS